MCCSTIFLFLYLPSRRNMKPSNGSWPNGITWSSKYFCVHFDTHKPRFCTLNFMTVTAKLNWVNTNMYFVYILICKLYWKFDLFLWIWWDTRYNIYYVNFIVVKSLYSTAWYYALTALKIPVAFALKWFVCISKIAVSKFLFDKGETQQGNVNDTIMFSMTTKHHPVGIIDTCLLVHDLWNC